MTEASDERLFQVLTVPPLQHKQVLSSYESIQQSLKSITSGLQIAEMKWNGASPLAPKPEDQRPSPSLYQELNISHGSTPVLSESGQRFRSKVGLAKVASDRFWALRQHRAQATRVYDPRKEVAIRQYRASINALSFQVEEKYAKSRRPNSEHGSSDMALAYTYSGAGTGPNEWAQPRKGQGGRGMLRSTQLLGHRQNPGSISTGSICSAGRGASAGGGRSNSFRRSSSDESGFTGERPRTAFGFSNPFQPIEGSKHWSARKKVDEQQATRARQLKNKIEGKRNKGRNRLEGEGEDGGEQGTEILSCLVSSRSAAIHKTERWTYDQHQALWRLLKKIRHAEAKQALNSDYTLGALGGMDVTQDVQASGRPLGGRLSDPHFENPLPRPRTSELDHILSL